MNKFLQIFSFLFGLSMLFVSCVDDGTECYFVERYEFVFSEDVINLSKPVVRYVDKYGQEKECIVTWNICEKRNYSKENDSIMVCFGTDPVDFSKPICYVWTYSEKYSCGKYGDIKDAETFVVSDFSFSIIFKDVDIEYVKDSDEMFRLFAGIKRVQTTVYLDKKVNKKYTDIPVPFFRDAEGEDAYLDFEALSLLNITGNIGGSGFNFKR